MALHSLFSTTNLVTVFTLILKAGWEVLGLHMVPHLMPPTVAEMSTDRTYPFAGAWGLAAETEKVGWGLYRWIVNITFKY